MTLIILEGLLSYIKKGYSLLQALLLLSDDISLKKETETIKKIIQKLEEGESFQSLIDKDIAPFLGLSIKNIPTLPNISLFIEHIIILIRLKQDIRKKLIHSLSYPVFLFISTVVVSQVILDISTETSPLSPIITTSLTLASAGIIMATGLCIKQYRHQQKTHTWLWIVGVFIKSGLSIQTSLIHGSLLNPRIGDYFLATLQRGDSLKSVVDSHPQLRLNAKQNLSRNINKKPLAEALISTGTEGLQHSSLFVKKCIAIAQPCIIAAVGVFLSYFFYSILSPTLKNMQTYY